MKKWMIVGICLGIVLLGVVGFVKGEEKLKKPKVAVVYSIWYREIVKNRGGDLREYDTAGISDSDITLKGLGYEYDKEHDRYENIRIKDLMDRITDYDIVIFNMFANQINKQNFEDYASQWKVFFEKGGILYINNAWDNPNLVRWLALVDKSFSVDIPIAPKEKDIIPLYTNLAEKLIMEPNEIIFSRVGRYMTNWAKGWRILSGFSETEAIILYQDYGKGGVLVTVYPETRGDLLENLWSYHLKR